MTFAAARLEGEVHESLTRAAARLEAPEPVLATPTGWRGSDGLSVANLRDARNGVLATMVQQAAALTGVEDQRVVATWLQGWWVYWALGPVLVAWLDEDRVAPIDPADVAVWWDTEGPAIVRLGRRPWVVLPDDPLAGRPGVETAPDTDALAATLHDRIVALLRPLTEIFQRDARVGLRQQWLQSADRIAAILQDAARESGHEAAGIAAAESLLDRPGSPLRSSRGRFVPYVVQQVPHQVYHRATCCLAFRAPGGTTCLTCPVRPAALMHADVVASLQAAPGTAG